MAGASAEQVPTPEYTLAKTKDDRLRLRVTLPGVESTSEVTTSISSDGNCVTVCVPGRYRLVLRLDVPVSQNLEELRFLAKPRRYQVVFRVLGPHCEAPQPGPDVQARSSGLGPGTGAAGEGAQGGGQQLPDLLTAPPVHGPAGNGAPPGSVNTFPKPYRPLLTPLSVLPDGGGGVRDLGALGDSPARATNGWGGYANGSDYNADAHSSSTSGSSFTAGAGDGSASGGGAGGDAELAALIDLRRLLPAFLGGDVQSQESEGASSGGRPQAAEPRRGGPGGAPAAGAGAAWAAAEAAEDEGLLRQAAEGAEARRIGEGAAEAEAAEPHAAERQRGAAAAAVFAAAAQAADEDRRRRKAGEAAKQQRHAAERVAAAKAAEAEEERRAAKAEAERRRAAAAAKAAETEKRRREAREANEARHAAAEAAAAAASAVKAAAREERRCAELAAAEAARQEAQRCEAEAAESRRAAQAKVDARVQLEAAEAAIKAAAEAERRRVANEQAAREALNARAAAAAAEAKRQEREVLEAAVRAREAERRRAMAEGDAREALRARAAARQAEAARAEDKGRVDPSDEHGRQRRKPAGREYERPSAEQHEQRRTEETRHEREREADERRRERERADGERRRAEERASEERRRAEEREDERRRRDEAWLKAGRPWKELYLLTRLALMLARVAVAFVVQLWAWGRPRLPWLLPTVVRLFRARKLANWLEEAAARGSWLVTIASAVVLYLLTRMGLWTLINLMAPPAWLVFRLLLWQPTWWSAALCSFALSSLVQGLPSLRSVPLFPLLCWLGGGGWLALLAPPAVFFGALCNVLDASVIAWACIAFVSGLVGSGLTLGSMLLQAVVLVGSLCLLCSSSPAGAGFNSSGFGDEPVGPTAQEVPAGAKGEVRRVLEAGSHYAVLEVAPDADRLAIKAAWRAKSLLTHPDKVGPHNIGANEAVSSVKSAYNVLSDERQRAAYDRELAARARMSEKAAAEAARANAKQFSVPCTRCSRSHVLEVTPRRKASARFCSACNTYHQAEVHDLWAEAESTSFWRTNVRLYTYTQGCIVDVTAMDCQGDIKAATPPNTHTPAQRFSQEPFNVPTHLRPSGWAAPAGGASAGEPPAGGNRKRKARKR